MNGIFDELEPGTEFEDEKLQINPDRIETDREIPADKRTMEIIKTIANSIDPMIKVTIDVPSDHHDKKVPMLDIKVWLDEEDNQLNYIFYQKEMKNRKVMMKSSAMPYKQKMTVLSQEVFRRLHNTEPELPEKFKNDILDTFMEDLMISGYKEKERFIILKNGMKTYENLKKKANEELRPFYRPKNFEKKERKQKKRNIKYNWFAKKNAKYTSVMFVNPTPNSELLKMLEKTENRHKLDENKRVKFVEKSGVKIVNILQSDPFATNCTKEDCIACKSLGNGGFTNCRKSNVTYEMQCLWCKDNRGEGS